jgi:hypothetical protein
MHLEKADGVVPQKSQSWHETKRQAATVPQWS